MQEITGGELSDIIDNECLSELQVATIMHQILSTISYIQKCRIIHRDIKPENILIERYPETR